MLPEVASRSLLDGILTVKRIDFLVLSGDGTRATVMVVLELTLLGAVRRARDIVGDEGVLEAVRDARDRRERPGGIVNRYWCSGTNVEYVKRTRWMLENACEGR